MHPVDALELNFSPGQMSVLNLAMAYVMFSVALDVQLTDFKKVLLFPKAVFLGLSIQLVFFPLLTLALIWAFKPPASIALGMILVSCCPSGNITNFLVHRAGANVALSVTLNAMIILLASISTPAGFYFWSGLWPEAAAQRKQFELPFFDMAMIIVQLIAVPLALGMLIRAQLPQLTAKIKKPSQTLSLVIFFAILVMALVNNRENLMQYLSYVFLIVFVHNALGLGIGYGLSKLVQLPELDARTLAFEAGVHNTALGMILIFNFFHGLGGMILIAAWWGIWDLVTGYGLAEYFRRTIRS
jgi:bile acid:Na+ symporter, BASS family